MTFVVDYDRSEMGKEPTEEQKKLVEKQSRLEKELYRHYNSLIANNGMENLGKSLMNRMWERYLKEYEEYKRLWCKYMGYCLNN